MVKKIERGKKIWFYRRHRPSPPLAAVETPLRGGMRSQLDPELSPLTSHCRGLSRSKFLWCIIKGLSSQSMYGPRMLLRKATLHPCGRAS